MSELTRRSMTRRSALLAGAGATAGAGILLPDPGAHASTTSDSQVPLAALQPSGDTTGAMDTANIQNALDSASGNEVLLTAGTFYINAPIVMSVSGSILRGVAGNVLSLTDYGTVIQAAASSSTVAGFSGSEMISLVSGEEQHISGLTLDGTNAPSGTNGIDGGTASDVLLYNIGINNVPGMGISQNGSNDAWRASVVNVHRAGASGFVIDGTDQTWENCIAQGSNVGGSGAPGWSIATCDNSKFIGCRSENTNGTGNGWTYTGSNNAATGVMFIGCSTNQSGGHGIELTTNVNAGGPPVTLVGCRFGNDGFNPFNTGTGGGSFAGIFITNADSPILINGCVVAPAAATTGNSPEFGLRLTSANGNGRDRVQVTGSEIWGASAPVSTDSTDSTQLRIDPSCVLSSGTGPSPTHTALSGTATLVAGRVAVSCPPITAKSMIMMTCQTPGGTQGFLSVAITPGTGFRITSTSSTDTSTVGYSIVVS
jgi:hypothetical protein